MIHDKAAQALILPEEWRYLKNDRFWLLFVLLALCGLLPAALDRFLAAYQIDLLGLTIFTTALSSYGLARLHPRLGAGVLILGTLLTTCLLIRWWPGTAAGVFALLPVMLAIFMIGWTSGLVASLLMTLLLVAPPFAFIPPLPFTECLPLLFVLHLLWVLGWINEAAQQGVLTHLFGYYQQARQLLEEARDQRLTLAQANQDLAEAYRQVNRLNELLRASQIELEAARRAKEEFVANVSHELRTPLNMIIGFSEMILNAPATYATKLSETLLADMGVIYRNSQHLSQMINDVLDLSQTEAGQLTLSRTWVDAAEIVREATEAVAPLYQAKNLTLQTAMPCAIPSLFCDRLRIRQILLNLLSNAGRFTIVGGVTVQVRADPTCVIFAVTDTGLGIRPEDQKKIFEPFQQLVAGSRPEHDSSGLGLSISKRLVELHGGKMWLESGVGSGSTFAFALPMLQTAPQAMPTTHWLNPYSTFVERTRPFVAPLPRARPQILVLDPTASLRHQISRYLGDVDIVSVATLAQLETALTTTLPNLILVNDNQVMADWHLIRRNIRLPNRIPVVSCYVPGLQEACEQLHVVDYLIKPITRQALLSAAERVAPPQSTLLLVEDDQEMGRLLARQLTSAGCGYRILRAADGAQALAFMRTRKPDAVFLDLGLPDQDGYAVLAAKNADPLLQSLPTIIVSARDPVGEPVVTNRLRVELADGLSLRDIILSAAALSQVLSPLKQLSSAVSPETAVG